MKRIQQGAVALATIAALSLPSLGAAAVPQVDGKGQGAVFRCGTNPNGAAVRAFHADKIVFEITGFLLAEIDADQPALDQVPRNTALDIKVKDDPTTVADLKGKVLTFLGARDGPVNRESIRIAQVLYAMVCPTTAAP
jgi:hypothetical protein